MKTLLKPIQIGQYQISVGNKPFIVAEMSGNHNQSLERALQIIDAAADAGVDAIKLQTYTADTLMIKSDDPRYIINEETNLWHGRSMYELYQQAHTPWEWHETLFKRCHQRGLICFSSPFDDTSVDFLEKLNCPCYKIASTENTDHLLLKKVAKTGKPIIISTGMATIAELAETVDVLRASGCEQFILLKCTAAYPANPKNIHLNTISHMRDLFQCHVGLSDHTLGIGVGVASVALGAVMIEKHMTLSRNEGGVDAAFSMEPNEFKSLVIESKRAWEALGKIHYGPAAGEFPEFARRSLYLIKDIKAGEILTADNMISKRPGYGIPVKYFNQLIGMRAIKNASSGTPLTWDLVKSCDSTASDQSQKRQKKEFADAAKN